LLLNCNTAAIDSQRERSLAFPHHPTPMPKFDMFQNQTCQCFRAGETIFRQGEPRTFMFVVNEGEVEIRIGEKVVEVVGPAGIFGEMAMIDGAPRTATTVARTDCKLVPIDAKRFQFLVQQTPYFAIEVMRVLASRLRRVDQLIEA
jgi:CRP/FNR family cyclic AMP-dependent transcriptional regulator